jgi:hypothetical protein
MCLHYPSNIPQRDSASFAATCWADYGLSPDVMYETPLGAVWSDFWVSFFITLFQSFIPGA